jgi:hypothetical protein
VSRRAPSVSGVSTTPAHPVTVPTGTPTFGSHAVFSNKNLQTLASIQLPPNIKSLNLENNQFVDFVGLVPSKHLEVLKAANNPLESLRGIPLFPKLSTIELSHTPFSRIQFYRVALLILFGKSLRLIDGERISATERQMAAAYPQGCEALVRAGWILTYPPPAPRDLPRITASLAGKFTQNRAVVSSPRSSPKLLRRPRLQSTLMDETMEMQEAELAKLEQDIRRVQASKIRSQTQ